MESTPLTIQRTSTLNIINTVGDFLYKLGINPFKLNADTILSKASSACDFNYDNPVMKEGLTRLVHSLQEESNLNTFGRIAAHQLINRNARMRFQIEKIFKQQPDIFDTPIKEPIIIIGFPRTGTTILHALLSQDYANRSPLAWECLIPHPLPPPENYQNNPQLDVVRREFSQLFSLVPDFKKKHYMEADAPQECIGIDALNFCSFQFLAQYTLHQYERWLFSDCNQSECMHWHRRFLQYLQSKGKVSERWLLKTPAHLMRLDAIFEVYPDAKIIMTHRHPSNTIPSTASLMSSVRTLYSDSEDPIKTGKECLLTWERYINKFMDDRKQLDKESQIIDLFFDDFANNQMSVVEQIYQRFNWDLSVQTRVNMKQFLLNEPKNKHGKHEYSLKQFAISDGDIKRHYAKYITFIEQIKNNS